MKLGIDLDGPTADWVGGVCDSLGVSREPCVQWDSIFTVTGMSPLDLFEYCRVNDIFRNLAPVEGAVEALSLLHVMGHRIHFVTHRPLWSAQATGQWLGEHLPILSLGYDLHFLEKKSDANCDVYLDDSPHVIKQLHSKNKRVVRFEQPWNTKCFNYTRTVKTWPEFVKVIGELDK